MKIVFENQFVMLLFGILNCYTNYGIAIAKPAPSTGTSMACFESLDEIQKPSLQFVVVRCPPCSKLHRCYVVGTTWYSSRSSVCCAGIHDGKMSSDGGTMKVNIFYDGRGDYKASSQHDITSREYHPAWQKYFTIETIPSHNVTLPTTPTDLPVQNRKTTTTDFPIQNREVVPVTTSTGTDSASIQPLEESFVLNIEITAIPPVVNMFPHHSMDLPHQNMSQINATLSVPLLRTKSKSPNESILYDAGTGFYLIIGVVGSISISIMIVLALFWWKRYSERFNFFRQNLSSRDDDCVCYIEMDSSMQGLLNDPEICHRPCRMKELKQKPEEEKDLTSCHVSPNCNDCSTEVCGSHNFEF